jgi:hypothetical protein
MTVQYPRFYPQLFDSYEFYGTCVEIEEDLAESTAIATNGIDVIGSMFEFHTLIFVCHAINYMKATMAWSRSVWWIAFWVIGCRRALLVCTKRTP